MPTKFIGNTPVDASSSELSLGEVFQLPGVAAGAASEFVIGWAESSRQVAVDSVFLTIASPITNNVTNYVTVNLIDRGPTGAGTNVLATLNTNAGSGVKAAYTRLPLVIDRTKVLTPGDLLTLQFVHTGSGQAVSGVLLEIRRSQ